MHIVLKRQGAVLALLALAACSVPPPGPRAPAQPLRGNAAPPAAMPGNARRPALHNMLGPAVLDASARRLVARGELTLSQSSIGLTPFSVLLGALRCRTICA